MPGRPRVLLISQNLSIPRDRRVWNELRALRDAGYETVAICPRGSGAESAAFERREGIDIFRFTQSEAGESAASYLREYAVAFWRIRRLARKVAGDRGFDVVQAANPPDFLLFAALSLRRRGARLVFDHHDLSPELYLARFGGRRDLFYRLTLLVEAINFRLADVVLSTNESYKRVAIKRGGKRPESVYVVRGGPDLARFTPVSPDPKLKRGRGALISFVGEIAPQDGVDQAIRALARLRERDDDWHATFAGDGPALEDARTLAGELGLEDHVEFAGWLGSADLRRLLSSSDVCVVPDPLTPLSDASTLIKIAEYMAMSKPVVAYDLTESRVTAGEAALYARPDDPGAFADAILELLRDPQRRARMGSIGRRRVEESLAWEHARVSLLAAYDSLLGSPGPAVRAPAVRIPETVPAD
ncbi:MAG: glycosyltransferase family 4 protein [Solirubrobacteraceae bacterium]